MRSPDIAKPVMAAIACAALMATCVQAAPGPAPQASAQPAAQSTRPLARHVKPRLDRSGRQRTGKASIYADKFNGRKMADGTRMDPQDDNAASKTLPLGATARVTNAETGQSAVVTIRDRGPHVPGRIVDLSPATAEQVGIDRQQGVSKVAVTPISLPPADVGAGSPGASQEPGAGARRSTSPPAAGVRTYSPPAPPCP